MVCMEVYIHLYTYYICLNSFICYLAILCLYVCSLYSYRYCCTWEWQYMRGSKEVATMGGRHDSWKAGCCFLRGWVNEWLTGWVDGLVNGRVRRWLGGLVKGWTVWVYGWLGGQVHRRQAGLSQDSPTPRPTCPTPRPPRRFPSPQPPSPPTPRPTKKEF